MCLGPAALVHKDDLLVPLVLACALVRTTVGAKTLSILAGTSVIHVFQSSRVLSDRGLHGLLVSTGWAVPLAGVTPEWSCFEDCGSGPTLDNPKKSRNRINKNIKYYKVFIYSAYVYMCFSLLSIIINA